MQLWGYSSLWAFPLLNTTVMAITVIPRRLFLFASCFVSSVTPHSRHRFLISSQHPTKSSSDLKRTVRVCPPTSLCCVRIFCSRRSRHIHGEGEQDIRHWARENAELGFADLAACGLFSAWFWAVALAQESMICRIDFEENALKRRIGKVWDSYSTKVLYGLVPGIIDWSFREVCELDSLRLIFYPYRRYADVGA